ncbi:MULTISPECIES: 50S ribosomal protein L23 [Metallosphaera]|uniref:Large ribosomal subunit protein uL23 n=3 Tax=Metallosphaera TaxID=41980 RepID=A4YCW8_METS5|nr:MULTISPECIES: 50S ribosomal protein L23 [Metallosphaera]ABP94270.1 LSU ribosomal protein L23P [Metallosphaera sedula DSM 5348]AIM26257.1 LSU ribosomal protein L23P [Metallosphaera sedula]AKV73273.1 50S ribosomal protein L23 [Metallosphaera sedula]AKV75517.1 50S ribosomal protein L23 [Metallosphaera sedula]AKV77763.1 50S ribosomal protein L23 [Metallosphaera sedula]
MIKESISTEKSVRLLESNNTLVLVVDREDNKATIKSEVEKAFGVKVEKVNVVITPRGEKKAYVKLAPEYKASEIAQKLGIL